MAKDNQSFAISKVTSENFEAFLNLVSKLADYEKLTPPNDDARKRLRSDCLGGKPKFEAFIGELDGKPVGYVIYFFTYSSFLARATLYIEDIFVHEEFRGREVGQRMFDRCRAIAKLNGCGRIEFTVLTWNKSAQQFYEKNHAKKMDWFLYRMDSKDF